MKGGIGLFMAEPETYKGDVITINTHKDSFYFNTRIIKKKKGKKKIHISINFQSPKPPKTQNKIDNSHVDNLTLDELNSNIGTVMGRDGIGTVMGRDGGLFNLEATDTTFEFKSKSFNVKLENYDKKKKSGTLTLSTSHQSAYRTGETFEVIFDFEKDYLEEVITISIIKIKPITREYTSPKKKEFTIKIIDQKIKEIRVRDNKKNKIIDKVAELMEVDIFTKEEQLRNQQEEFKKQEELQKEEQEKQIS